MAATVMLAGSALGAAHADTVNLLDIGNRLIRVDSKTPGTIISTIALTGIKGNETLLGFDYRPASPRVLYGVATTGQVYAINPLNGAATAIGTPVAITGTAAGVDFNPAVDRIRVVSNTNQNLRLNPDTGGLAGADTPNAYAAGDPGAGSAPRITGAAYSNNVAGGTPTTLYVIDSNRGVLATQGSPGATPVSPNTGQLFTVGSLGVASNDNVGFDIARNGTVLATFTQPGTGTTTLYSVNLTTGAATAIGVVGTAGRTYLGLAIAPPTVASYGVTANQIAVGTALDNFVGAPSAALNATFIAIDGLAPADQAAALSQLTPSAYTLLPEITLQTVEQTELTLRRYLRDFRTSAAGSVGGKFGAFLVGIGRDGSYDPDVDRAPVSFGTAGIIGGFDYRLNDRSLIGLTGGYNSIKVKLGTGIRDSEIRNYFGGAYATTGIGPLYVDVFGTYGEADYDLRRGVNIGTASFGFAATTKSKTYVGGGTAGLNFALGTIEVEPFVGARYAQLKLDGFSEGAGFAALTLDRNKYQSVLGTAGLRLAAALDLGGAKVRPEVRGAYRHEFRDDRERSFTFGFGGIGAGPLNFTPTALRKNYYTAGAGFTVSGAYSPVALVVDYDGEFDRDRSIHGITGGLRVSF